MIIRTAFLERRELLLPAGLMSLLPSPPQTPSAPKPRAQTQELGIWEMNASSSGSVFVFPYQPHNDSAEMADNDSTLPNR